MKKTALLTACMVVLASTTLLMSGCHKDDTKTSSNATEPSATPIATVAPTKATLSPTKPAPTQPSATAATATQAATLPTAQSATFNTQIATGTMPATVPTGTEITSLPVPTGASSSTVNTDPYATANPDEPTTYAPISGGSGLHIDENGNYTVSGVVIGYGPNTVIVQAGDGNTYEFNYSAYGSTSYNELSDGMSITVVADDDPSGAGVPNATQVYLG